MRRCLIDLDILGMRALWRAIAPEFPQPYSDAECLVTMHAARAQSPTLPKAVRVYSAKWLKDHSTMPKPTPTVATGVGLGRRDPNRQFDLHATMIDAVLGSIKAGIDIDEEGLVVREKIKEATDKFRARHR